MPRYMHHAVIEAHRHYGRKYAGLIIWGRILWFLAPYFAVLGAFVAVAVGAHWLYLKVGPAVVAGLAFGIGSLLLGAFLFSKATASAVAARQAGGPVVGRSGFAILTAVLLLYALAYMAWT